jgi:hypothetical protein
VQEDCEMMLINKLVLLKTSQKSWLQMLVSVQWRYALCTFALHCRVQWIILEKIEFIVRFLFCARATAQEACWDIMTASTLRCQFKNATGLVE